MTHAECTPAYRICAVNEDRWDVLRSTSPEPVASFSKKHVALAYAMSLARGGTEWDLAVRRRQDALRSIFDLARGAPGSGV